MDVDHSEEEGSLTLAADADCGNGDNGDEDLSDNDEDSGEPDGRVANNEDQKSIASSPAVLSLEERREKAKLISATRILSQKEFAQVRQVQLAKKVDAALPKR